MAETIRLSVDAEPLRLVLDELAALLETLPAETAYGFIERFLCHLKGPGKEALVKFDRCPASWADEISFVGLPGDGLREILSALRTGDLELAFRHLDRSSVVDAAISTIGAAGAVVKATSVKPPHGVCS